MTIQNTEKSYEVENENKLASASRITSEEIKFIFDQLPLTQTQKELWDGMERRARQQLADEVCDAE